MERAQRSQESLSIDPVFQPARYFLAQLRRWEPGLDHLGELTGHLERCELTEIDTSATHYALAKELEDLGLYPPAPVIRSGTFVRCAIFLQ